MCLQPRGSGRADRGGDAEGGPTAKRLEQEMWDPAPASLGSCPLGPGRPGDDLHLGHPGPAIPLQPHHHDHPDLDRCEVDPRAEAQGI